MFVFGVEVDGQWANIKESYGGFGLTFTDTINYFFTARGRLGVAAQNFLFYGTGGYAHSAQSRSNRRRDHGVGVSDRGGWTAGGGVEVGFGNASVKLEYLYCRPSTKRLRALACPVPGTCTSTP